MYLGLVLFIVILLTYLLTYFLLSPCSTVLLEKLTGFQLVTKFDAFYGTPKVHCRSHKSPPPGPYAEPARSSPYPHIPLLIDPS
jgi:hypothetical protein